MSNVQFESVDGNFYDIAGQQGLIDPATGMPAPAQPAQPPVTRTRTSATEFVRDGRRIRQTVYSDGTTTEVDLGPDDSRTFQAPTFTPRQDARNTIRAVLATFGLDKLSDVLYDKYVREEVNISNPDALIFSVRDTTEYQARFAANARRAAKNLPELDPASYLALENQYRDLMRSNGFDPGFYDQTTDFEKFIENDISPSELQSRIAQGFRKVADADPEVKRQMKELYGVDETGLAQYFIDPERSQPASRCWRSVHEPHRSLHAPVSRQGFRSVQSPPKNLPPAASPLRKPSSVSRRWVASQVSTRRWAPNRRSPNSKRSEPRSALTFRLNRNCNAVNVSVSQGSPLADSLLARQVLRQELLRLVRAQPSN